MPSIINSDNGAISGSTGLKTTGGSDGALSLQTNGSDAVTVDSSQRVTFNNSANLPNTFGFKNRIINGGMTISQRNGTSSVNVSGVAYAYQMDRFYCGGLTGVATPFTLQQVSDAPTGFVNSAKITVANTDTLSNAATEYGFQTTFEGNNTSDFNLGTANAVTVTLSFWVKSSLTGTFGIGFRNAGTWNRTYVATYTINAANTWEQKTVTVAMDTTGTWGSGTSASLNICWSLGVGTNLRGTANTWQAGGAVQTSGSVNLVSNAAATWQITGVQLERGTAATSFDFRDYGRELIMCQRYYYRQTASTAYAFFLSGFNNSTTRQFGIFNLPQMMRAVPTLETTGTASNYAVLNAGGNAACTGISLDGQTTNFSAFVIADVASGLTAGQGSILRANNTTSAYLAYSAEL